MKPQSTQIPSFAAGVFQVWWRNYLSFRKSFLLNLFWMVVEPLLVLLAIGYGLGTFVSNIQGITFVDFFFPAILCLSAMMVSFYEASYGNFTKLRMQNTYAMMILSPLEPPQIVLGEIAWAATKGTLSALIVALIAGTFGHLDNWMLVPAIVAIFLSALYFASLGMLITSYVKSYDGITIFFSGLIIPMSLFSGTYFPFEQLPLGIKYLAYVSPLSHSVALVRGFLLGGLSWGGGVFHVFILVGLTAIFLRLAIDRISKRLRS
jgi:lipooligosaccharide transport system permease protein